MAPNTFRLQSSIDDTHTAAAVILSHSVYGFQVANDRSVCYQSVMNGVYFA